MSQSKPRPLNDGPSPAHCPVCGKPSYSATGMHPQCAVTRADAISHAARKAALAAQAVAQEPKTWTKLCPKCRRRTAARRAVCDCGHRFVMPSTPQTHQS